MLLPIPTYLPKDFIETAEGLCFAVVVQGVEHCGNKEKVLCFLRYIKDEEGKSSNTWQKVDTEAANCYLEHHFPQYLHYSTDLDAALHGVDADAIICHHKPKQRLQQVMTNSERDQVEQDLSDLCGLFQQNGLDLRHVGVTGSILIGAQQTSSDIDLVFYDRGQFHKARSLTARLIENNLLNKLDDKDWVESYARRSCSLSLDEYVWHEQRKFNKALINNRKFDLNLVVESLGTLDSHYTKCGAIVVQCKITDDWYSYDYPAIFKIDHDDIDYAVCFTATYTGQAVIGETVEITGLIEQIDGGGKRIVVGSSREAPGEYIKVLR